MLKDVVMAVPKTKETRAVFMSQDKTFMAYNMKEM